jgi:hypothetical protein
LVRGFKDKDGKFHPIGQSGVRKSRQVAKVRYANDAGLSQVLGQSVKDFAKLNRDRYNIWKKDQGDKFDEELRLRRKFRVPLIRAFRLARDQEITKPKELEKFIRQNIPDLPKGKKTNRFVEKVLKEFVKEEKRFKSRIAGKSEEEQKKLETSFERALTESEAVFNKIEKERDQKFEQQEKQDTLKWQNRINKINVEANKHKESEEQLRKDNEALRKRMEQEASKADVNDAKEKVNESAKEEKQEQRNETNFASDVFDELAKDQEKSESMDFEFGFPSEIV